MRKHPENKVPPTRIELVTPGLGNLLSFTKILDSIGCNAVSSGSAVAACSKFTNIKIHTILSRGTPFLKPFGSYDPSGFFIWGISSGKEADDVTRFRSKSRCQ
jgi:hypothetical protein